MIWSSHVHVAKAQEVHRLVKITPFIALFIFGWATTASAKPAGPRIVCEVWAGAPLCEPATNCTTCHTTPPARNPFGLAIEAHLDTQGLQTPTDLEFEAALPEILRALAAEDSDGDGASNETEILAGTSPGDAGEVPATGGCSGHSSNPRWNVCGYDRLYVFKKVSIDTCGHSPGFDELEAFRPLDIDSQDQRIDAKLDECLESRFWLGRDGVLWRIAHPKIKPLQAIKSGNNPGAIPLADYNVDYALFAYTQSGDRDARDVLTADYYATFDEEALLYERIEHLPEQRTVVDRRAGMLTTAWFFVINTMFTPVPRSTAAQAYRAYLGLDVGRSEGLIEPPNAGDLIDYDDKGVLAGACASCHRTLDPLTYPFTRYHGIAGEFTGFYDPNRMERYNPTVDGARVQEVPEAGHLFGQSVANLTEWASVGANHEAFSRATVRDYWRVFVGHDPNVIEEQEFATLVQDFAGEHQYVVERMLHALIRTEAYGVP
jgi:hypothetical protein